MIYNDEAQLWLPDDSVKTDRCWRFITRNTPDLDKGTANVKKRTVAVQAGGHVGIFPNYLAKTFGTVYTFEPDPVLFDCLCRNAAKNVQPINAALSNQQGHARFRPNVGGTGALNDDGELEVRTLTLDGLNLRPRFIHLDVEGHEVEVLQGAKHLMNICNPVLQLEVLPRHRDRLYDYLAGIDYVLATDACRDHVFVRKP